MCTAVCRRKFAAIQAERTDKRRKQFKEKREQRVEKKRKTGRTNTGRNEGGRKVAKESVGGIKETGVKLSIETFEL